MVFGGETRENIRPNLEGYIAQNKSDMINFEVWNSGKLASLIQGNFLREELLPKEAQSDLRKSIALIEEPASSFNYFSELVRNIAFSQDQTAHSKLRKIRQINICLWVLFSWAREAENIESAYLASELALLHSWELTRKTFGQKNKAANSLAEAFTSTLITYEKITSYFAEELILPHTDVTHALSFTVSPSCNLDVNLKLFDILGRISLTGIWLLWKMVAIGDTDNELKRELLMAVHRYTKAIFNLFRNNPTLLSPIKDSQIIDISIAFLFFAKNQGAYGATKNWLNEIIERAHFSLATNGPYPCIKHDYASLIHHPDLDDPTYKEEATAASVFYPMIALISTIISDNNLYKSIQSLKQEHLPHCTFQFWYPDETSEDFLYTNTKTHGATLTRLCIEKSPQEFQNQAFLECKYMTHFDNLSAVKSGFWPIVFLACRHYRLPIPIHIFKQLNDGLKADTVDDDESE